MSYFRSSSSQPRSAAGVLRDAAALSCSNIPGLQSGSSRHNHGAPAAANTQQAVAAIFSEIGGTKSCGAPLATISGIAQLFTSCLLRHVLTSDLRPRSARGRRSTTEVLRDATFPVAAVPDCKSGSSQGNHGAPMAANTQQAVAAIFSKTGGTKSRGAPLATISSMEASEFWFSIAL